MGRLLRSAFFKLKRDLTLRITLIIGAALALLMVLIYAFLDYTMCDSGFHQYATGQNMLLGSFSATQNFGLAIPINLAIFTTLEFSQGTIRNKVVVGNSKLKIYLSLVITGLIFTFFILISYLALSTLLGTMFGAGFFPSYKGSEDVSYYKEMIARSTFSGEYIAKYVVIGLLTYVTITTYSIFMCTLTRNVGPTIPLVVVPLILLTTLPMLTSLFSSEYTEYLRMAEEMKNSGDMDLYREFSEYAQSYKGIYTFDKVLQYLDPLYLNGAKGGLSTILESNAKISNELFIASIISNVSWSICFTFFGSLIFNKRDLK